MRGGVVEDVDVALIPRRTDGGKKGLSVKISGGQRGAPQKMRKRLAFKQSHGAIYKVNFQLEKASKYSVVEEQLGMGRWTNNVFSSLQSRRGLSDSARSTAT